MYLNVTVSAETNIQVINSLYKNMYLPVTVAVEMNIQVINSL